MAVFDRLQLYRAFWRWCRVNGDRLPPNQANFSAAVTRYAHAPPGHQSYLPVPLRAGLAYQIVVAARNLGHLNGVRWYDFANECVAAFDLPLSRFYVQHVGDTQ